MEKENKKAYLIGGGIASLSVAAFLIRDGNFQGKNIFIFEESNDMGGSLDGKGSPKDGYICRGGRMFTEEVWNCTFDLLSFIPLSNNSTKTLLDDFNDFNKEVKVNAKARLIQNRKIINASDPGLNMYDRLNLFKIILLPESFLENLKIEDLFSPSFFKTNFWFEWCTMFAFNSWHSAVEFKRYMLRFIQDVPYISTMTNLRHTRYNQYDSVILPLTNWLKERGVNFLIKSRVSSLKFVTKENKEQVEQISYLENDKQKEISVGENDLVFLTNGSMTTNSTFGNMKNAPILNIDTPRDSWALWKDISKGRPHFGNPSIFNSQINKTKWESFTVTLRSKNFIDLIKNFSKNSPGTGGITTFKDSNWLLSIAVPHQPHFINQPDDIFIFGGIGLLPDKEGNYIHKKMSECTGEEIMTEICLHLGFTKELPDIIQSSDCVPCMMPYITSQFMPRKKGDRPEVIPKNTGNFAFIGQFCEIPDEIVFTVEQSVRSAMIAVYGLLNIKKEIPPIYKGQYIPGAIEGFIKTVFNIGVSLLTPLRK